MVFENEVLVESYRLIYRFIYQGGKIWMNGAIQKRVKWLYHKYGMTRKEVIEYIKWKYKGQQKHRKFNPEKSCLETYVLNFTYFTLLSLVRQCKKHDIGNEKEILFSDLVDHEPIKKTGASLDPYERQAIEGLIDQENPEDVLIGSELMELARSHIGKDDLAVIIGLRDKSAEARRLGLNYDTYRKRLQRKLSRFRSLLNDAGYDID